MSEERIEYDADKRLVKIYRSFAKPKTLVPNDELKRWGDVARAGEDEKGRDVETVRYVFSDEETAKYNHQPVAFAGLQTYFKTGDSEKSLGKPPNFSVREDFGIKGEDDE